MSNTDSEIQFHNPETNMTFTYDKCFLCGKPLDAYNRSDEHMFPKWLLNRFALWDNELVLLNNTSIKYRNLTIPCCVKCNNEYLGLIENRIGKAVEQGIDEFKKLDENDIALWLLKIKYGLLFKELSLKIDRSDPYSETIITAEFLHNYSMDYTLLQATRYKTHFHIKKPWSVLIFEIIDEDNTYFGDDYIASNSFYMQLGKIGLIVCYHDSGANKEYLLECQPEYLEYRLHPLQFRELCAMFHYKITLMKVRPFCNVIYPTSPKQEMHILYFPLGGEIYRDWNSEDYAKCLIMNWQYWGFKFDDIYKDGLIMSYLHDNSGNFRKYNSLEFDDWESVL